MSDHTAQRLSTPNFLSIQSLVKEDIEKILRRTRVLQERIQHKTIHRTKLSGCYFLILISQSILDKNNIQDLLPLERALTHWGADYKIMAVDTLTDSNLQDLNHLSLDGCFCQIDDFNAGHYIAARLSCPVFVIQDVWRENAFQALSLLASLLAHHSMSLDDLRQNKFTFMGDIALDPVANSLLQLLNLFEADVSLIVPALLQPQKFSHLSNPSLIKLTEYKSDIFPHTHFLFLNSISDERCDIAGLTSEREYHHRFCLTKDDALPNLKSFYALDATTQNYLNTQCTEFNFLNATPSRLSHAVSVRMAVMDLLC
jgi:aspartate carbamoyltransferase catalytic subunit